RGLLRPREDPAPQRGGSAERRLARGDGDAQLRARHGLSRRAGALVAPGRRAGRARARHARSRRPAPRHRRRRDRPAPRPRARRGGRAPRHDLPEREPGGTHGRVEPAVREAIRNVLAERLPLARVRALASAEPGIDEALWREAGGLGWFGLGLPEAAGGGGYGAAEEMLLFVELGRALTPGPW